MLLIFLAGKMTKRAKIVEKKKMPNLTYGI